MELTPQWQKPGSQPPAAAGEDDIDQGAETVTPRQAAQAALEALDRGHALATPPIAMGPRPVGPFAEALDLLGRPAPTVAVRCNNFERCGGRRLCRWVYDQDLQAISPDHGKTSAWTQAAPYWLDRANANKGPVRTATGRAGKPDGNGTHNYRCRCGRNIPVSAERRFRLYLNAIANGRREILI